MSQLFLLDTLGRLWGQKPTDRACAHRTEVEIRTKAHRLFCSLYLSGVAIRADYTWASPSHLLFADFHRSSPLGRIQHHTKRQRCAVFKIVFQSNIRSTLLP